MNYRHAYHAGNFADVLKHVVLALVIEHLKKKPAPFRVIDTHAGAGLYDLAGPEAGKTGEWREGIGRLTAAPLSVDAETLLAPYIAAVRGENAVGALTRYPGSPRIARFLMRPGDRLVANELHPEEHARLDKLFARDPATRVLGLDAWVALKSLLPPKERRGVVLVDSPFEAPNEHERLVSGLLDVTRRFATGTYLLWYPVKEPAAARSFHRALAALHLPKLLQVDLTVRAAAAHNVLIGTGLIVLNPPHTLCGQLATLLPALSGVLAAPGRGSFRMGWLGKDTGGIC